MLSTTLLAIALVSETAFAQAVEPTSGPPLPLPAAISDDEMETIVVVADPFQRWDGTRWFIKTELVLPIPLAIQPDNRGLIRLSALQVRTVLACEKEGKISRQRHEVLCRVEDIALQAAAVGAANDTANQRDAVREVLEDIDRRLTAAAVQLQVTRNGRVVNIDLEGVSANNRRQNQLHELLRLVLARVAVGFDMRVNYEDFGPESKWVEYTSALMAMPIQDEVTQGNSVLIHRMRKLEGHLVVESRGRGMIAVSQSTKIPDDASWNIELAGVSVYDSKSSYMRERVWTLQGTATSSNWLNQRPYLHAGRIVQLREEQRPSLGATQQVSYPGERIEGMEAWTPLEQ